MGRKKNIIIYAIILVSISILIYIYIYEENDKNYTYTVEYKNNKQNNSNIYFSVMPGFYEQPFYLEICAPTNEIYYTLDGTDPNKHSLKYKTPIYISDASLNENIHSSRIDTSTLFINELKKQYKNYSEYSTHDYDITYQLYDYIPDYKIDKATIIKAVYYDKSGKKSNIECGSYFIGYERKDGYNNINIVSIVTDPYNLFDYENGIYVLGAAFDKFIDEKEYTSNKYRHWWTSNYSMKGKKWERQADIQFFNTENDLVLSQKCGIRIQGSKSRGYPMKSLSLYARKEYDGNEKIYYDFFENGYLPDTVTLHAGGSDHISKFKNPLISNLSNNLNFTTMNYVPYVLFLDGEYWGLYYLTEKYDASFISNKYGVSESEVLMIKNAIVANGDEKDIELFQDAVSFVTNADMTIEENFEKACQIFEIDSLMDYFATEIYIANGDWSFANNSALWRTKNISSNNKYADGKWRWMLFDVDVSSSEDMVSSDSLKPIDKNFQMFTNLCANKNFRTMFSKRILEIGKENFSAEKIDEIIENYLEYMDEPMNIYFRRFFGTSNKKMYEEINSTKLFFHKRYPYVEQLLKKYNMI